MAFQYAFAVVSSLPNSFQAFNKNSKFDLNKARDEHLNFVESLRQIGVDVLELEPDERHPEGVKVDDTAVILNGTALMCSPYGSHRQGEVNLIRQTLKKELGLKIVEMSTENANLSGSDVLFTGKEIVVGISAHTNEAGAQAVARSFPEYAVTTVTVLQPFRNLKDAITMAGVNLFAIGQSEPARKMLMEVMCVVTYNYKQITLPEDLAAQTFYINHILIHLSDHAIPNSFGVFENKIDFNRLPIDLTELYKAGITLPRLALLVSKFKNQRNIVSTLA